MAILLKPAARFGTVVSGDQGTITFDATISDTSSGAVEWTQHAIESGAVISDHAIKRPRTFSITGTVTRTPLNDIDAGNVTRLEDAVDRLFRLMDARQLVTVTNGLWVLSGYGITSVDVSRDSGTGQAATISVALQEITVVSTQTAQIPPEQVAAEQQDTATAQSDQGTQTGTESEGEEVKAEVETSLARAGVDWLTGRAAA